MGKVACAVSLVAKLWKILIRGSNSSLLGGVTGYTLFSF